MEKRKPTFDLASFREAVKNSKKVIFTRSSLESAFKLGFDRSGMVEVIQAMEARHFYKSMTSNFDSKLWQDVYHVPSKVGILYIKFTTDIVAEFMLLSFKEKTNG